MDVHAAKAKLDAVISKQRSAFYKPIQVAEIIHRARCSGCADCQGDPRLTLQDIRDDLEMYRNLSKRWRDAVTRELIGRVSISSQKFQDNLFEKNAIPPSVLSVLAEENRRYPGIVERYIYQAFWMKLQAVHRVMEYVQRTKANPQLFELSQFMAYFEGKALRRSVGKAYEIAVYALFDTLVHHLKAQVSLSIDSQEKPLLQEFEDFARLVLGVDTQHLTISHPAAFYRAGVTNAADRGVDIWANFGPVVQVKHLSLSPELAEDISEGIRSDWLVIVCKDADQQVIQTVMQQLGLNVRGIITQSQLETWYEKALRGNFADRLSTDLLRYLESEFVQEFPSISSFMPFYRRRGYGQISRCDSPFWREDPWGTLSPQP